MSLYQKQAAELAHGFFTKKRKPNTSPANPDYQDPNFKKKTQTYTSSKDYQVRLNNYLASYDQKIQMLEASVADAQNKLNKQKTELIQAKKDRIAAKAVFDKQYNKSAMVTVTN